MRIPQELIVLWEKPLSCLGRVIPATLAPVAPVLAEYSDKDLNDIPGAIMLTLAAAMVMAFFSGLSGWLSTGSTTARSDIAARSNGSTQ